jgi:hypothetical protein
MLSKCNVNDRRKFDIIVVTVRLYNAGGRHVYHITKGCFQWGTCETVVGMGIEQHGMGVLHRTRGGTAWDMMHQYKGKGRTDAGGGSRGGGGGQHTTADRT